MANTNSDNETAFTRLPPVRPDAIESAGVVRYYNDTITPAGTESTTDTMTFHNGIPKGAKIDLTLSRFVSTAHASLTLSLGSTGAATSLATTVSLGSAGSNVLDADAVDLVEWNGDDLIATIGGASPQNAKIRLSIAYYIRN